MADKTKIEWTEATWNPITGCTVHSAGCTNCYAMKLAGTRMKHHWSREGLTKQTKAGPVWNGEVRFNEKWLDQPMRWAKPRMIFVCAHADLFHESVPDEWIAKIFNVMAECPQHTFQVLTKRSDRMRKLLSGPKPHDLWHHKLWHRSVLPNVWLGVSVENQAAADERIPDLLNTPAAVRWLSCEPLLGPVDLKGWIYAGWDGDIRKRKPAAHIRWVVAGGESGPGARPMHPDWARSLRDQCAAATTPFFFKQWGDWAPDLELWAKAVVDDAEQSWFDTCVWDVETERFEQTNGSWMDCDQWYIAENYHEPEQSLTRIGKAKAGRFLDGMTHDGMPA